MARQLESIVSDPLATLIAPVVSLQLQLRSCSHMSLHVVNELLHEQFIRGHHGFWKKHDSDRGVNKATSSKDSSQWHGKARR